MASTIASLFTFLALIQIANCQTKNCGNPADIVFLIDTSLSIWPPHFEDELEYLQNITKTFDVQPGKTRIGALSFSKNARKEFDLGFYEDKDAVVDALGQVFFTMDDQTDTDKALRMLREDLFTKGRKGVPHIALIVTDGQSSFEEKTLYEARKVRQAGIEIFAIGIGRRINMEELRGMASSPYIEYVHHVESFDKLAEKTTVLGLAACRTTTPVPTTPASTVPTTTVAVYPTGHSLVNSVEARKVCGGKPADVTFVMDASSSINASDFKNQLEFVKDVVDIFDIGPDKTRVAAVSFSSEAKLEFHLNKYTSKRSLQNRLLKVTHVQGSTFTDKALELVRDEVMLERNGFRRSVAHIVIVITDGQSKDPIPTAEVAAELKRRGVYVFAIGVGDDTDLTELIAIASEPSWNFVFHVEGYDALSSMKNLLAVRTCIVKERGMQGDEPTQCAKVNPADVMFVADFNFASGSDVIRSTTTVRRASRTLSIGKDRTRVGFITNGCPEVSNIDLNDHFYQDDFASALTSSDMTPLSALLKSARRKLTGGRRSGSRRNAKKVMVVIVNGPVSDLKASAIEFLYAARKNIKVVLVKGSKDANPKELHSLAENAKVLEYDKAKFESDLADAICAGLS